MTAYTQGLHRQGRDGFKPRQSENSQYEECLSGNEMTRVLNLSLLLAHSVGI